MLQQQLRCGTVPAFARAMQGRPQAQPCAVDIGTSMYCREQGCRVAFLGRFQELALALLKLHMLCFSIRCRGHEDAVLAERHVYCLPREEASHGAKSGPLVAAESSSVLKYCEFGRGFDHICLVVFLKSLPEMSLRTPSTELVEQNKTSAPPRPSDLGCWVCPDGARRMVPVPIPPCRANLVWYPAGWDGRVPR